MELILTIVSMQFETSLLPAGAFESAGHAKHAYSAICPTAVEYWSAPQLVHAAFPTPALYVPAAQSQHTPPSRPVYPALHLQSDSAVLAARLLPELAGHVLQCPSASWPVASRYLPDAHSSQPVSAVFAWYLPSAHSVQVGPE